MPDFMEIEATKEFEKDTKRLTGKEKQRLDEIIKLLTNSRRLGKQLHHLNDVFSIRIENKRLVYQFIEKENKIILMFFKSREDVYDYLL